MRDASPFVHWRPTTSAVTLASGYSHSIINGSYKPLIRLASASSRAGFTVRCTATSSGIPARSFHHRSTPIENSRRFHNALLSRSIEIYRVLAPDSSGVRRLLARRAVIEGRPASKALSCCRIESFGRFFLPSRRSRAGAARQCASADDSAVSFHGLIFAGLAFATLVS
jgi:hypothetical protein